jgi:3,4-dihydroxy 2-butanone 4-phosphate synthase/GTP cyclohydrolase II
VTFAPIPVILDELRAGRMIVLVDDEKRENEGDLVCAAQFITPQTVNFMTKEARGLLCVAMDAALCDALDLSPQAPHNTATLGTAFTVSVDAHPRFGVTTGVSATDRAITIARLADPAAAPADFARPGHIHPLRARQGGVLVRTGQTEGSVDLCHLAGLRGAAVIIEIMNDDGSMARLPELQTLCQRHGLKMCSVADVIAWRLGREKLVHRIAQTVVETDFGPFNLIVYQSQVDPLPHVALTMGRVGTMAISDPVLVRVHPQNLVGDVFGDAGQPTGRALRESMRLVQQAGEGAILYMRQDPSGGGIMRQLQQTVMAAGQAGGKSGGAGSGAGAGADHVHTDASLNIGIGSQILRDLGIERLRVLTNNPSPYYGLEGFGLSVEAFVPIETNDSK